MRGLRNENLALFFQWLCAAGRSFTAVPQIGNNIDDTAERVDLDRLYKLRDQGHSELFVDAASCTWMARIIRSP